MISMIRSALKIAILLPVVCLAGGIAETDYLLTGLIAASDGGKSFAVIEQKGGKQNLVGEGDKVEDGRVEAIDARAKTVRLVFPDDTIVLRLSGSAHPVDYREAFSMEDYEQEPPDVRTLDAAAVKGLLTLSGQIAGLEEEKLSARFNSLLGLSEGARIAAFRQEPVDSTAQLLERIAPLLGDEVQQGNFLGTIAVADRSGRRRIYLNMDGP